jgi:hypothetical protein
VGFNGILECSFLSENAHHAFGIATRFMVELIREVDARETCCGIARVLASSWRS